jgi:hypothetical protein
MANGDQVQGGGGGQRTYSEEDVMALMNETARRASVEAIKNVQKKDEYEDDAGISVINPRVVKQLKDTVSVFTALKELSSSPLQKTIEETVGGMAASVVQSAFAPRGPPPRQDIVDKLLNSQFAYGLGSGLGQRAPELVETMGKTFGKEKAGQMMDNIIGKYGTGGGQPSKLSSGPSSGPSSSPSSPEQNADKQSEKELLLSLDPNNPEHVSAYAETQGGLPVDVARKMLMIHQDAFIEQLKRDGMNVDQVSTQRGSRAQSSPHDSRREPTDPAAVQQPSPIQQAPPVQPVPPSGSRHEPTGGEQREHSSMRQDIHPTYPANYPGSPIEPPSSQSHDSIEYAEYNDVTQPGQDPDPNQQPGGQPVPPGSVDGQQVEMMKTFATDIGKVMGEMLNKIESLNNTVFTLQSEMNDMKKQGPGQPPPVHIDMPPRIPSYPLGMANAPMTAPMTNTPSSTPPHVPTNQQLNKELSAKADRIKLSITRESIPVEAPSLETFEDQVIDTQREELDIERSGDFFGEDVIDVSNFKQELDEEAKPSATNSNVLSQIIQQQTPLPGPVQPAVQSVPPVQSALPIAQITKPAQVHQSPVVQQPMIQRTQHIQHPVIQPIQPIMTEKENNDDKDNIGIPKNESIVDIPKTESEELNKIPMIPDSKTSEEKNDNNFVTPTNQQLNKELSAKADRIKLSKKVGIHKKAAYRNIKPLFKKNDGEENKEDSNV